MFSEKNQKKIKNRLKKIYKSSIPNETINEHCREIISIISKFNKKNKKKKIISFTANICCYLLWRQYF